MSKKSVINFHSGQCGIQIGWELWTLYCSEHNIDADGYRRIDVEKIGADIDNFQTFFYETAAGRYVPRAIFIDGEASVNDALRASPLGGLMHDACLVNGLQDCRNVLGMAYHPSHSELVHEALPSAIRRQQECSDVLAGYEYFLSASGGSGPGYTCRALEMVREANPKSQNHSHVVLPSPTISQNTMEEYNAITYLGMIRFDQLYMNCNTIFDNEALYRQAIRLDDPSFIPTYQHVNQLVATSMSSATASLRWDGQLNVDLSDFETNLVPYPTMHHLFHTFAPLNNNNRKDRISVEDLTLQAFRPEAHLVSLNCLAAPCDWSEEVEAGSFEAPAEEGAEAHGFIGCCMMYRGDVMPVKVNQALRVLNATYSPTFVSWVPNGFKNGVNTPPLVVPSGWTQRQTSRSLTCIINSTCIMEKLKQFVRDHRLMKEREAYPLWFEQGKMSAELVDACKDSLVSLISQYETALSSADVGQMRDSMTGEPAAIPDFRVMEEAEATQDS